MFGAYYGAVTDACYLVADMLPIPARKAHANQIRLAGAYWAIRSAYAQTMTLVTAGVNEDDTYRANVEGYIVAIRPMATNAYLHFRERFRNDKLMSRRLVKALPATIAGDPREVLKALGMLTVAPVVTIRATRYYQMPGMLSLDLYTQGQEMLQDVMETIRRYATEKLTPQVTAAIGPAEVMIADPSGIAEFARYTTRDTSVLDYWAVLVALDEEAPGSGLTAETEVGMLPIDDARELEATRYATIDDFKMELSRRKNAAAAVATYADDAVF